MVYKLRFHDGSFHFIIVDIKITLYTFPERHQFGVERDLGSVLYSEQENTSDWTVINMDLTIVCDRYYLGPISIVLSTPDLI